MKKFIVEDVLGALQAIMETNTNHYQSDFQLDIKALVKAAKEAGNTTPEDRTFLWMARPNGTWCLLEKNVFLKDSWEHEVWRFYGEQTSDKILAYRVEVSGIENNKVNGRLYELDYENHIRRVKTLAVPAGQMELIYERGERTQKAEKPISRQEDPVLGDLKRFILKPDNPGKLAEVLYEEHENGERLRKGDVQTHIVSLQRRAGRARKKKAAVI